MSADTTRRRKSARPAVRKVVKASLLVDVELHTRWAAGAALQGLTRNAFAVEVLTEALRGLHVIDRRTSVRSAELTGCGTEGTSANDAA